MLDKNNNILNEQRLTEENATALQDLLPLLEIAASPCFVTIGNQDELDIYARYMMYRVQQDFYDLVKEYGELKECAEFTNMSWDEFVLFVRKTKGARAAAVIVIRETLKGFFQRDNYNFNIEQVEKTNFNVADEMIHFSALFAPEEGRGYVECLLFHAELSQYKRQLDKGTDCNWTDFLSELQQGGSLWDQVRAAFIDALTRLDFKPFWQSAELAELLLQQENQEA